MGGSSLTAFFFVTSLWILLAPGTGDALQCYSCTGHALDAGNKCYNFHKDATVPTITCLAGQNMCTSKRVAASPFGIEDVVTRGCGRANGAGCASRSLAGTTEFCACGTELCNSAGFPLLTWTLVFLIPALPFFRFGHP